MEKCFSNKILKLYLEGTCSEFECDKIAKHILTCDKCRTKLSELEQCTPDGLDGVLVSSDDVDDGRIPVSTCCGTMPDVTKTLETMSDGYEFLGEMPRGGQAVVYKAVQKSTKRVVAVKVLLQGTEAPKIARYRFEKEIELAASLKHSNIVTIFDSGIAQGLYFYAMEFIDGVQLDDYVQRNGFSVREIMELFLQVVAGVSYAHQKGVIHRDLKPGNILVDTSGKAHILDFGLAKVVDNDSTTFEGSIMTSITGQVLGTLAYMAPEQAIGKVDDIDVRTDIYALGVILYKLITGKYPYDISGSVLDIVRNIQENEPERPTKNVKLHSDVEIIILKSLQKLPQYRYQSAYDLYKDIESWLNGYPIAAKADNLLYIIIKLIARYRYRVSIVGLVTVIVIAFGAISIQQYLEQRFAWVAYDQLSQEAQIQEQFNESLIKKSMLNMFLIAWDKGDMQHAAEVQLSCMPIFNGDKYIKKLVLSLMEYQQLEERSVRDFYGQEYCWIASFIFAEKEQKEGDSELAIDLYEKSLEEYSNSEELGKHGYEWLVEIIRNQKHSLEVECQ